MLGGVLGYALGSSQGNNYNYPSYGYSNYGYSPSYGYSYGYPSYGSNYGYGYQNYGYGNQNYGYDRGYRHHRDEDDDGD